MYQLDILGRHVNSAIKSRGREYYQAKAVRILFADDEFVTAQVKGSQRYEVDLERDGKTLYYSCDCPHYEGNMEVCKHVWATLIALSENGHLQKWKPPFPEELTPAVPQDLSSNMEEFEDDDDADDDSLASPYGLENIRGKASEHYPTLAPDKKPEDPSLPYWHRLLNKIRLDPPTASSIEATGWPAGREIIYVLELSRRTPGDELSMEIGFRDLKKTGGWKKYKPLPLGHDRIAIYPNPIDRQIIGRLLGVKRETWFYSNYESAFRFQLKGADFDSFFPLISDAGRLFFRIPEIDELRPIQWDAAGQWEFRILARKETEGSTFRISGSFIRGDEQLNVVEPERISSDGIFLLNEKIGHFRGSYPWIKFFRKEGILSIPERETDLWLEKMFQMPEIPTIDLPEELKFEGVTAIPRPIAHISSKQEAWGPPYMRGDVRFDYLGHEIAEGNPIGEVLDIAKRQRIFRNWDAEKQAAEQFEKAGFKRQSNFSGKEIWKIAQTRLASAIRELVSYGWQVKAEGKLFRTPDSFSLHITSGIDWFELHGSAEFGDSRIAIPRLLSALRRHEKTVLLDDGSFGILPEEWLKKYGMLAGLGTAEADHVRFSRNQAGLLDAILASQPGVSCDDLFVSLRSELQSFKGISPADPPSGFIGLLRPYQRDGLGWLHFLQTFSFGGCLADDMGLGKTVQVLALLEERRVMRITLKGADRPAPSLVVMPRSLVFNWRQEAARFTPELTILEHTGAERIRGHEHFDDYDVVFTTYGTLRRDALFFKDKQFDYVILDEAQAIKNAATESAKASRLLQGRHRLALSGTPVENHLGELWSLFEFLNPGMLGASSVLKLGKSTAINDEESRPLLAHALRPFILRRTKAQVAPELPVKVEQTLFCSLDEAQRALYNELRDHYRRTLLNRIERDGLQKSKIHILEALLRLRQAAIHPGLIDASRSGEPSAKLDMLMPQLLEVLDEGHKALVFSQFTSMLSIVRKRLDENQITYEYLDGKTRDREAAVERFQNDPECRLFLISLKAGGLGLNLTAAEYVFLLDPWWNPAVEAQAIDRTHRIGQTQSVFAYRLIAKDTVEEKVLELQQTKREIADAIINQDNSILSNLRAEDLEILLS